MRSFLSCAVTLLLCSVYGICAVIGGLQVSVIQDSNIGGLSVRSPLLPNDTIRFGTCEGIVNGNRDYGLFLIKLDGKPENGGRKWQVKGNEFAYEWTYKQGIILKFSSKVEKYNISLTYTLTNNTTEALNDPNIHVCLQTTDAPSFFPGQPYTGLFNRLFLWSKGQMFAMSETELGSSEQHLAFVNENESPLNWGWWKFAQRTFDIPLLAMASKDGKSVVALAFEDAVWASCNAGDERACVHLFPYFGEIKPGQSASAKGRLYILNGTPEAAMDRFYKDFRPGETPSKVVKVAMCQIFCLDGDREGNFVRIENALRDASKAGADIACFPESSILGWVNPDAYTRAFPIPGNDSDRLCELARRYKLHLCIGLDEKDEDKLYDSAVLIDDTGKILLKHRKMNNLDGVKGLMVPNYTSGEQVDAVDTRFGKVGVLICADTFDDKNLKNMADRKPVLLLVPYGWVSGEMTWPKHGEDLASVVGRAAWLTGAPVVGTDSVGEVTHGCWAGGYYGGASVACDPQEGRLGVAADRDRDVKIVEITLKKR